MMRLPCACLPLILVLSTSAVAQQQKKYEVPPSNPAGKGVPYISDEAMKVCVKLFNEAKWLADDIKRSAPGVDRSSSRSVNAHNAKVERHRGMISNFNRDCAGKQSESAWRAAQELNKGK
jgi:hypothetical protein